MTVTVTLWYVLDCAECIAEVERVTRAAVRDMQVTKLTLSAGHKHNHPTADEEPSRSEALESRGQQTLQAVLAEAASPNGFDNAGGS